MRKKGIPAKEWKKKLAEANAKRTRKNKRVEGELSKAIGKLLDARGIFNDRLNSGKIKVSRKYFRKRDQQWVEYDNYIQLCKE